MSHLVKIPPSLQASLERSLLKRFNTYSSPALQKALDESVDKLVSLIKYNELDEIDLLSLMDDLSEVAVISSCILAREVGTGIRPGIVLNANLGVASAAPRELHLALADAVKSLPGSSMPKSIVLCGKALFALSSKAPDPVPIGS